MIEDLFTLPTARRQGVATAMITAFIDRLRAVGCHTVFLAHSPQSDPDTFMRAWVSVR
jgi:GNAT superfamily N-acetyltransferase